MAEVRVTRGGAKATTKATTKATAKRTAEATVTRTAKPAAGRRDIIRGEHLAWKIRIPDHAGREQSSAFRAAKKLGNKIVRTLPGEEPYGPGPWHMHHGGSLWAFDGTRWRLFMNTVGIEWSAQFCADPAKIDQLRLNARALYEAFPATIPEMERLGYPRARKLLDTPITDTKSVAAWVDSVFNACVPMAPPVHAGVLPTGGGRHHYPAPITDIVHFKFDDFELFVTDPKTNTRVAVLPVSPRGSGDWRVTLTWAPPDTPLAIRKLNKAKKNERVIFQKGSVFSREAFHAQ
jgi:uncharacterized protein DUF6424